MAEDIEGEIDAIVDRFPPGGILAEFDRNYLREMLKLRRGPIDLMIYTLGRARNIEDRDIIVEFLNYSGEVDVPSRALRTLCFWIDSWQPYSSYIIRGIMGEAWDIEDSHKLSCVGIAGDVLGDEYNQDLVDAIIKEFMKVGDKILKDVCYSALERADGLSAREAFLRSFEDRVIFDLSLIQRLAEGKHNRPACS